MASQTVFLRNYGDTNFITGIRAIAASMVVMVHTAAFSDFGPLGQAISSAGKYGVEIFFVISGFTIAKTFTDARDYRAYLTRRLARILPLYWFIICTGLLLITTNIIGHPVWMLKFGSKPDFYNLAMHLSMLSFLDYKIANSILGVEWSIPIEVFWYIFMPALIVFGSTLKNTLRAIALIYILTGILAFISKKWVGTSLPINWMPVKYGHLFFLGVLAFHMRPRFEQLKSIQPKLWIWFALILYALSMTYNFGARGDAMGLTTTLIVIFLTADRMPLLTKFLTLKPMLFLGSISYSLYLWHYIVLSVLKTYDFTTASNLFNFIIVYGITVALSAVTYLVIEKPSNDFGRRLVNRNKQVA